MKAANRRFLERTVHPLNLPVGPRMERLSQTMLNAMPMTYHVEPMWLVGFCSWALGELCAVICQHGMNPVRQLLKSVFEELGRLFPLRFTVQLGMGELRGSINRNEEVCLAFPSTDLADIHVQVTDRVLLEGRGLRLFIKLAR